MTFSSRIDIAQKMQFFFKYKKNNNVDILNPKYPLKDNMKFRMG